MDYYVRLHIEVTEGDMHSGVFHPIRTRYRYKQILRASSRAHAVALHDALSDMPRHIDNRDGTFSVTQLEMVSRIPIHTGYGRTMLEVDPEELPRVISTLEHALGQSCADREDNMARKAKIAV